MGRLVNQLSEVIVEQGGSLLNKVDQCSFLDQQIEAIDFID